VNVLPSENEGSRDNTLRGHRGNGQVPCSSASVECSEAGGEAGEAELTIIKHGVSVSGCAVREGHRGVKNGNGNTIYG
jgi:hypothetical protein